MSASDAAVLGGGPAGSLAALLLARRGLRVVLVEAGDYTEARIGEHLVGRARKLLAALGHDPCADPAVAVPTSGRDVLWAEPRLAVTNVLHSLGTGPAAILRSAFDRALAGSAEEASVRLRTGTTVVASTREAGRWRLTLAHGGGHEELHTALVVDASGRRAAFARARGARAQRDDDLLAVVAWGEARCSPRALMIESLPQGWCYALGLPDATSVVALISDSRAVSGAGGVRALWRREIATSKLLPSRFPGFTPRTWRIADAAPTTLSQVHGEGWISVGDAAGAFDPLWGQGISHALETASRAIEVLSIDPRDRTEAASLYAEALRQKQSRERATREVHYAAVYSARATAPTPGRQDSFWRRRLAISLGRVSVGLD